MSLAQVLSFYLNLNLLLAISFVSLLGLSRLLAHLNVSLDSRSELRLHYNMLLLIIGFTCLQPLLPKNQFLPPAAKVWSAPSTKGFQRFYESSDRGYVALPAKTISASRLSDLWIDLTFLAFIGGCLFLLRDFWMLFRIRRGTFLIRKIGKVSIRASDKVISPFSFWLPGEAYVILPTQFLENPENVQIAVAHELQHHRQGDTRWVYMMMGVKWMCFLNPAVYFWNRWIMEIQEFACDEALVDQRKVSSQAYARCLVEVAQTALNQKRPSVCATGMSFLTEHHILKRRIEKMLNSKRVKTKTSTTWVVSAVLVSLMSATALASKSLVQDRRVTMEQAQIMADKVQRSTGFPIVVNSLVLSQLNRYVGTPEGRTFIRNSIQRMENHKGEVGSQILKHNLPEELMAVPIVESGYANLPQKNSVQAAGLWQIIPSTAKHYGLKVDTKTDERLDVTLSTDAALRYLLSNQLRFQDWPLAVLAYNMGEHNVQTAIDETGSRDAWTLVKKGYEGDKDYLARVMAAILILRNPELVD